jgi:hypothetical protein
MRPRAIRRNQPSTQPKPILGSPAKQEFKNDTGWLSATNTLWIHNQY